MQKHCVPYEYLCKRKTKNREYETATRNIL